MDAVTLVGVLGLGAVAGTITGLVPGLHVNTLAGVAVLAPTPDMAVILIVVGTVHTFVTILPTTYLGAPGEDTAVAALPAHQMLSAGRGPDAVRISVHASLAGLAVAILLILPLKWLLTQPGGLLSVVDGVTPWLLLATVLLLAAMDKRTVRALVVAALAACLGWIALHWRVAGVWGPSSALLPLLSGLFGLPTLIASLQTEGHVPHQRRAATGFVGRFDIGAGTAAAAITSVLPGMTAAVATALARPARRDEPRGIIATLSAVNTAHLVLALAAWWTLGRSRSGLALAAAHMLPSPVPGAEVGGLRIVLVAVLAGGVLGTLATMVLDRLISRRIHRLRTRHLAMTGILIVVGLNALLAGWTGLGLLGAAVLVGLVPLRLGVRRVHLTACLLVPIAILKLTQ